MTTIIIATNNKNKIKEINSILCLPNVELKSLADIGFEGDIIEDGNSFIENATIKAEYITKLYGLPAISDDSGLEVRALNWEPGIYSARYYQNLHNDELNNKFLIENLKNKDDRYARYTCAIVLTFPDGRHYEALSYCEGEIIDEARGDGGFGYDPYFYLKEIGKTFAEISLEEKNKYSHRAKAIRALKELLEYEGVNFE